MKKLLCVESILTLMLVLTASIYTFAQEKSACLEFQKLVNKTYGFKPSKLSETERNAKSDEMDKVWNAVKANRRELLPCLRETINSNVSDGFFRFDASNLLIQLDQSDDSKSILTKAYAAVDLADVNLQHWMPYVAILGYEGFDTSSAGENWLKFPKSEYYLPQHGALKVDKESGALIIYGSMDESIATPALSKIASQENHVGRDIAAMLLVQQVTPESFQILRNLSQKGLSEKTRQNINAVLTNPKLLTPREGEPKVTRQQYLDAFKELTSGKSQMFLKLAAEIPDGEKDAVAVLKSEDIPLIRRARRVFAASANPHSAEWYKSFTDILMVLTWKPDITKQKA